MKEAELPLGFGMALAQNQDAMNNFFNLTIGERNTVVERAKNVNSKNEMQQIVDELNNTAK